MTEDRPDLERGEQGRTEPSARVSSRLRLRIQSPSDWDDDPVERRMWGDFWVKHELSRELARLGFALVEEDPDVVLHLYGLPPKELPEHTRNLVWAYSHPDTMDASIFRDFERIFVPSQGLMEKLAGLGYRNLTLMPGATSKKPHKTPLKHDVVFVGNARRNSPHGRPIVRDVGRPDFDFKVWGKLWEKILPKRYIGGRYWEYERLEYLYASARICLNDHHPDMARAGVVSARVFDILASGGFVISDQNPGLDQIFGSAVPQYEDASHLSELIEFFLKHPRRREELMAEGRRIALNHTYRARAGLIAETLRSKKSRGGACDG